MVLAHTSSVGCIHALSCLPPSGATCLQQQLRQEREPSRMGLDLRDLKSGFFDEVGSVPIPMTIAEQARRHRNQCW
jgi:hypothetical protein